VIAVPHAKWDERPLLIVVPHPSGPPPSPEDVLAFMQASGPAESAPVLSSFCKMRVQPDRCLAISYERTFVRCEKSYTGKYFA